MEIIFRRAEFADAEEIGYNLRNKDLLEVLADGCRSGIHAVEASFTNSSEAVTIQMDGRPIAMFGLVPDSLLGNSARVWFLGTDELARMKKTFVKMSRKYIRDFLRKYPVLWNLVDQRYAQSILWLKSCGAEFSESPIMRGGYPFLLFSIRRT